MRQILEELQVLRFERIPGSRSRFMSTFRTLDVYVYNRVRAVPAEQSRPENGGLPPESRARSWLVVS